MAAPAAGASAGLPPGASALAQAPALERPSALAGAPALVQPSALEGASTLARPSAAADPPVEVRRAPPRPPPPPPAPKLRRRPRASRATEPAQAASSGELTGLRLLLDQLDALLRDPRLALWLKNVARRLGDGARSATAAALDAARRLARLRLRLPRRLLLGLLALLLALVVAALLTSGGDDRATTGAGRQAAAPASAGLSLPAVAMPGLRAADVRPKPVRVALVLDRTYAPAQLRRELRTLGSWLGEHHAAGTRVTIIDARSARASAALRPSELAAGRALHARPSTPAAIRAALGRAHDHRLLVTLGSTAPSLRSARTLSITARRGAAASIAPSSARRSRAAIDDRRPNALAATVARAIMAASGQRERR
ncbi:MAG: hypothetical protein QOE31_785 [Solirubrobacteraceae bacterium]|nr:hypothetical protein [Solirubrobacteraceae bacterium]